MKRIKLKHDRLLDSTSVVHGEKLLSTILDNLSSQKVLWEGASFMNGSQIAELSEPISKQPHGIVLVFSYYSSGAQDYGWITHFVPKLWVQKHDGLGISIFMMDSGAAFNVVGGKYLYIHDSEINGNSANEKTGTGSSGIKYQNNRYVLRYVIGV